MQHAPRTSRRGRLEEPARSRSPARASWRSRMPRIPGCSSWPSWPSCRGMRGRRRRHRRGRGWSAPGTGRGHQRRVPAGARWLRQRLRPHHVRRRRQVDQGQGRRAAWSPWGGPCAGRRQRRQDEIKLNGKASRSAPDVIDSTLPSVVGTHSTADGAHPYCIISYINRQSASSPWVDRVLGSWSGRAGPCPGRCRHHASPGHALDPDHLRAAPGGADAARPRSAARCARLSAGAPSPAARSRHSRPAAVRPNPHPGTPHDRPRPTPGHRRPPR